jgi:hypothetical protein
MAYIIFGSSLGTKGSIATFIVGCDQNLRGTMMSVLRASAWLIVAVLVMA